MPDYDISLAPVTSGFDGRMFWAQARAGIIPGEVDGHPVAVLTAQPALCEGSDVFFALSEWRSSDLGETWDGPVEHTDTLGRREEGAGIAVAICDMTPSWHAVSRTLLSTGQTVRYADDRHPIVAGRREPAYAVCRPGERTWTPWQAMNLPERPEFEHAGAGSAQRLDLADGTVLLPLYFRERSDDWHACHAATVVRCSFDGSRLEYVEHGSELTLDEPRGFCEPSLTCYGGRYYLTLRNDVRGYVAVGDDGLHFASPVPWRFDDGSELGNYNTQQHWVTHSGGLFLVYTRCGLNNDNVFRHRAPLMIAQVDPEGPAVIRDTERELVPNRGARLGNFAVCDVSPAETWVTAAEWMQPPGCEKYGSDNTIWAARIRWHEPNLAAGCPG